MDTANVISQNRVSDASLTDLEDKLKLFLGSERTRLENDKKFLEDFEVSDLKGSINDSLEAVEQLATLELELLLSGQFETFEEGQ